MSLIGQLRARVAVVPPQHADLLLALAFATAVLVETALVDPQGESRALSALLGVLVAAWIALRRRRPLVAVVGLALTLLAGGLVPDQYMMESLTTPFLALLVMLYSTGRHCDGPWLAGALALLAACLFIPIFGAGEDFGAGDIPWFILIIGLPVTAGRALRSRALLQRELREKAERAELEHGERARRAVEEERDRIAAELQAVVANGVSAMVVQAEAVPRLLSAGDAPRAGEALAVIEATGRDALSEMRRLLGVLRREGEGAELAPQPGLARLDALVARMSERGLDVALRVEGERRELAPGIDLTAYRVLEDALEAALERDATSAAIRLSYAGGDLELEISDDRAGGASERLAGLRERVALYGGSLLARRPAAGGFRLTARLPLREAS